MPPILAPLRSAFTFGQDPFDPSHRFVTSWLLSPWLLFLSRSIIAIYILFMRIFIIAWECSHPSAGGCLSVRQSFSYFTDLTSWGLLFYFAVSALHTLDYLLSPPSRPTLLSRFPRPLQALHALFYSSIVTYPFIVTSVFWGVLYKGQWFPVRFDAWSNVSQHALNSVFALFEILLPRTETAPAVHAFWLVVILAGYLAVAYITVAEQGFYPYDFLDWRSVGGRGFVAVYILGLAAGSVVVFALVDGAIALRRWVTEDKLGMTGKAKEQRMIFDDDVESQEVESKPLVFVVAGEPSMRSSW